MAIYAGNPMVCVMDPETGLFPNNKWFQMFMSSFEYTPGSDSKVVSSMDYNSYAMPIDTVDIPKPIEVKIKTKMSALHETLNLVLRGKYEIDESTVSSSTVTKDITLTGNGLHKLGDKNIDLSTVVLTKDTVDYVLGTDYLIREREGFIWKHPNATTILADGTYSITYQIKASSGIIIESGRKPSAVVKMEGNLERLGGSRDMLEIYIPSMTLTASSGLDFLAEDHSELEFTGSMLYDPITDQRPTFRMYKG
jgi:hypothetical protein